MKGHWKHFLLVKVILLVSVMIYAQTQLKSCSSFRKGFFAYRDSASNTIRDFKRTSKYQVEKDKQTGLTTRYKIEWIADCTYKLTQVYANKKAARKKNNSSQVYTVVAVTEGAYKYRCTCNDGTEIQGTVVKME